MTDPAAPRPGRGLWPMAAISLLAGLLATFLVLQWTRRDAGRPQAPPLVVVEHPTPTPDSTPAPPPGPSEDPAAAGKRAAEEERRLQEAEAAAAEARRRQEEEDRNRRRLALLADEVAQRARKLWEENRYDEAEAAINEAVRAEPGLKGQSTIDAAAAKLAGLKTDALAEWQRKIDQAARAGEAGRYGIALDWVRRADVDYRGRADTKRFHEELFDRMRRANMVRIPGGLKVRLGTPGADDEPVREYSGPGYLIDRYEVTNEEYLAFVIATERRPAVSNYWRQGRPVPGAERLPVTGVTAADAEAYAAWIGKRLPTEDEWEHAARVIDGRIWPWGDEFPEGKDARCNSIEHARAVNAAGPSEVGRFPNGASAYGVEDLSGNVAEWTASEAPLGDRRMRVIKGGSFAMPKGACRAAARFLDDPQLAYHEVGFRCVMALEK